MLGSAGESSLVFLPYIPLFNKHFSEPIAKSNFALGIGDTSITHIS